MTLKTQCGLFFPGARMQLFFIWTLVALSFADTGAAQDLKPSTSWRKPNITTSKDECISIASAALEKAISNLTPDGMFGGTFLSFTVLFNIFRTFVSHSDSTYGTPGRLYAQMVEFDRLTNQTKYKDMLKHYFVLAELEKPGFMDVFVSPIDYGLSYGYAAAHAYTTYQDNDFLDWAVTSWTSGRLYTISESQAALGIMDKKQFNMSSSCQDTTMAGGTFWSNDTNEPTLNSLNSGSFFIVSALLAEATSNETYLNASMESANFLQSDLLNLDNNIMLFSISSKLSDSCLVESAMYLYDSAVFVEGLAILASITSSASTEALLCSTAIAIVSDSEIWQGIDGVIDTMDLGGHYVLHALAAVYEHNTTSSDLCEYIEGYIVQYNAVIEQATSGGSNIYGVPWTGLGLCTILYTVYSRIATVQ
ncbi:uncharacterized protein EV420DRAFT_1649215 [Desarmillaria tabescens]|uniref:Glycoside hydrolase family 76 protein n=1 Tax=Armillaria tabescens TaxID=1929756 RepID=A0AA39JJ52_ARMTA|nr:uncharacterized protein EV420DRAFT_1649215 [Desarmillaria tabescens]KAK0443429.1 hypothetical protein EV420DRAFT_1649215 [Desarmillaria tabescens]